MARRPSNKLKRLDKLADAIGYICIFWAWLESGVDELIFELLAIDEMKVTKAQKKSISHILASHGDIRTKVKFLRGLAFIRKWDDKWFKKLNVVLDKIDNDLRNKRNRFVHDAWFMPKRSYERRTRQIKFKRPQAFLLELSTEELTPARLRDLHRLSSNLVGAQIKLAQLTLEFRSQQEVIDAEVQKHVSEKLVRALWAQIALHSSQNKSVQQTPHPPTPETRLTGGRSRSRRQP